MKIDLKEINKIWINLDKEESRSADMKIQFQEYDLNNHIRLPGIENENRVLGCGLSMYSAVSYAHNNLPCLVLEDDAKINPDAFRYEIEVPDETDAIYLGISHWGMRDQGAYSKLNGIGLEEINEDLYKIDSMCSLHAVVYITKEYAEAALNAIEERNAISESDVYVGNTGHVDIGTALIQKDFFVVAPRVPYFYQNCQRNKIFTEVPLNYKINMG